MTSPTTTGTRTLDALAARYRAVRQRTEWLCSPLGAEDQTAQSMPDASPAKWHRAHTTWFFETFVLAPSHARYEPLDTRYRYLFNSYYNAVGPQFFRPHRGLVTRPTVADVTAYRAWVDGAMLDLLEGRAPLAADAKLHVVEGAARFEGGKKSFFLTNIPVPGRKDWKGTDLPTLSAPPRAAWLHYRVAGGDPKTRSFVRKTLVESPLFGRLLALFPFA